VPASLNIAALGYGYSFGNVLLDPSLPIEDATAKVHSFIGAYVRTFSFFGMSAKADVIVPFAIGDWEGKLAGQDTSRSATGFGDPAIRLSVNFVGAPALQMPRFMTYRQRTIVGASLRVIAPLGQYDNTKLINLGTNRWTFVPRIGVSRRLEHWNLEAIASAWLFTTNPDMQGRSLEQDPLWTIQGSVAYLFEGGAWLAVDAGWGSGGRASVNGVQSSAIRGHACLPADPPRLPEAVMDRGSLHPARRGLRQPHPDVPVPVGRRDLTERLARPSTESPRFTLRLSTHYIIGLPHPGRRPDERHRWRLEWRGSRTNSCSGKSRRGSSSSPRRT
jgi:hypothetical protein